MALIAPAHLATASDDPYGRTTIVFGGTATKYHKVQTLDGGSLYLQADWTQSSSGANTFTLYSSGWDDPLVANAAADIAGSSDRGVLWTEETGVTFTGAAGSDGSNTITIPNWGAKWCLIVATATAGTVNYRIRVVSKRA